MTQYAISVENLTKEYRLGVLNHGTLVKDLQSAWARWRGLPDPNAPIEPKVMPHAHSARLRGETFYALEDVTLDVEEGETLGIIGANGAGKSTFLKLLSRITMPTAGRIRMKGRLATLLEVGTGFHPELTGRENVYLNGAILGMSHEEVRRKFDEIVAFADIDEFIDTPVKRYSSGMYVRLAFAVAAHLEPEILIVDEVLAVGDLNFQRKCLGRMSDVNREGRTILFVSHNLPAIGRLCRKTALFEDGRLVAHGDTGSVIARYVRRELGEGPADQTFAEAPAAGLCGKIRRIRVEKANGEIASSVELTEPFDVIVDYELVEAVKDLTVSIEVHSEELSVPIIGISDSELDLGRLERREPGHYSARVRIPPRILNTGSYHIRSGMVQARRIVDVAEAPIFRVEDHVGIVTALGYDRKNGATSIQLPWEITRLGRT
ncbi:MAG TPA: ABC transporter ATP-binding protein [Xanthobacteraceae bacterium]|nr:ABC transporter ATP-binding protein [Xanthobacteraceae bacterium]